MTQAKGSHRKARGTDNNTKKQNGLGRRKPTYADQGRGEALGKTIHRHRRQGTIGARPAETTGTKKRAGQYVKNVGEDTDKTSAKEDPGTTAFLHHLNPSKHPRPRLLTPQPQLPTRSPSHRRTHPGHPGLQPQKRTSTGSSEWARTAQ